MAYHPKHRVERGIFRLLHAPDDVPIKDAVPWSEPPMKMAEASPGHRAIFREYADFLADAIDIIALGQWDDMIEAGVARGLDPAAAEEEVYRCYYAGPAQTSEVVWAVRTHWLKCVALNRELPPPQRVPPQCLCLQWLIDEGHQQWVTVLTAMPYWPLGMDEKGNWV
jgi:hypothetical protein